MLLTHRHIRIAILCTPASCLLATPGLPAQATSGAASNSVKITVLPERPRIERGRGAIHLNFDFKLENVGVAKMLSKIELWMYDRQGALVLRKYVDRGGTAPGLDTVRWKNLAAGGTCHIFNPYYTFDTEVEPARLKYVFEFRFGNRMNRQTVEVRPDFSPTKTALRLPMEGRLLVSDGHDFLSHHRRLGMDHPIIRAIGASTNSSRYALDFNFADKDGATFKNRGSKHDEWHGWNKPVFAPGDGVVVHVVSDFPDNALSRNGVGIYSGRVSPRNMNSLLGNCVFIDHGNGEVSAFGHLKNNSVQVAVGQKVKAGHHIANLGLSGATSHVHLHYQLQTSADPWKSEGIPAYFHGFRRYVGTRSIAMERGMIDSGDFIEHIRAKGPR